MKFSDQILINGLLDFLPHDAARKQLYQSGAHPLSGIKKPAEKAFLAQAVFCKKALRFPCRSNMLL